MIQYDPGKWSVFFACSLRGSVFPKAFVWAAPCSALSLCLHTYLHNNANFQEISAGDVGASVLSGFTFILGFLVVFRSQQAYSRWWEGGTLLQQLRGEWFNAYSSLMAFCNSSPEKKDEVAAFQQRLARLCSLLYCTAIQQVSTMDLKNYELIDLADFDAESMKYLTGCHDRCEVCLQWIQRLICDASDSLTIKVAPPILSRVYNQLGNGIVNLNNARKITEFPIPFPLAQMITFMLLFHWLITAFVCAASVERSFWAGILSFIVTFSFWSIHYIAVELEQPFGDDANDLPLHDMQVDMNDSLVELLDPRAQQAPRFTYDLDRHSQAPIPRCSTSIEDLFGDQTPKTEKGWLMARSLSTLSRKNSKDSNGNAESYSSAKRRDVDGKPQPAPPVAYGQRQDAPAGLTVFSCAEESSATTSWPEPEVPDRTFDRELATAPPAVLSSSAAHAAEPPFESIPMERRHCSGHSGHDLPGESPSTSKDQPVPALPRRHAERVVISTESEPIVPGLDVPGHLDCRRSARREEGVGSCEQCSCYRCTMQDRKHRSQCSRDTLPRDCVAAQTQDQPDPVLLCKHAERCARQPYLAALGCPDGRQLAGKDDAAQFGHHATQDHVCTNSRGSAKQLGWTQLAAN
mmetsp:Transcript_6497/g.12057  ORF Transcript_6497/g.12057 Transcript_6497/m.12057 type:complete len:633 (+) Transcript_6497:83-1981(+)